MSGNPFRTRLADKTNDGTAGGLSVITAQAFPALARGVAEWFRNIRVCQLLPMNTKRCTDERSPFFCGHGPGWIHPGPNGEHDWIVMDPDIDFGSLIGAFDTVLMGRKTCVATRKHGGSGLPGMQVIVFSHTFRQGDCPGVTVSEEPLQTLEAIKAMPGEEYLT